MCFGSIDNVPPACYIPAYNAKFGLYEFIKVVIKPMY